MSNGALGAVFISYSFIDADAVRVLVRNALYLYVLVFHIMVLQTGKSNCFFYKIKRKINVFAFDQREMLLFLLESRFLSYTFLYCKILIRTSYYLYVSHAGERGE